MNLAKLYLATAYPDRTLAPDHLKQLAGAGQLEWTKTLLRTLEAQAQSFAPAGSSPIEAAGHLESQQMDQFRTWRDQLADKVGNPSLRQVELVFVELSSPQALAIRELDDSYAIALDRRMHGFLGSITAWAYVAAGFELRGVKPVDARSVLLESLADHVQLAYLGRTLPESFERRELRLATNLGQADWQVIRYASQLAAKFVLLHELAHVHLKHFGGGRATPAVGGDTAELSAFRERELEFAADRFANEHLMDGEGTVSAAVVAKVAAPIFFYVLAMKEAMLPSSGGPVEAMIRIHPASTARAERFSGGPKLPAYLPQWETLFAVPELLKLVYESAPFQAAARFFASRAASSGPAFG